MLKLIKILLAVLLIGCSTLNTKNHPEELLKTNVVQVTGLNGFGMELGKGTAFYLGYNGKTYLITNRHVCGKPFLFIDGKVYSEEQQVVSADTDLCAIVTNHREDTLRLSSGKLSNHMKIMTAGYSRGEEFLLFKYGEIRNLYETIITVTGPMRLTVVTSIVVPGDSGSPLIDEKGMVVGVMNATDMRFSYAVPLADLQEFLGGI